MAIQVALHRSLFSSQPSALIMHVLYMTQYWSTISTTTPNVLEWRRDTRKEEEEMRLTDMRSSIVFRWWFAALLLAALLLAALATTPQGQALAGRAEVAAQYVYYVYLSQVFKP